jgi:hypothetical protein
MRRPIVHLDQRETFSPTWIYAYFYIDRRGAITTTLCLDFGSLSLLWILGHGRSQLYISSENKMDFILFKGAQLGPLQKIRTWGVDVREKRRSGCGWSDSSGPLREELTVACTCWENTTRRRLGHKHSHDNKLIYRKLS